MGDGSTGSGFFVSPDGLLVTNYHVAGRASEVTFQFDASDEHLSGEVIAASACADLALIQAEPGDYEYLEWAPEAPRLEERIRVIGFPQGTETISFQDGIVAKESTPSASWGGLIGNFETSAIIDNGNSGGPVVNEMGEVLGVTYASRGYEGSSVENSLHLVGVDAQEVLNGLMGGTLADPGFKFDGWEWVDWTDMRVIDEVFPGGTAAAMGLQNGDAISQYGDLESWEELLDFSALCDLVQEAGPDGVHTVVGYRPETGRLFDGSINHAPLEEWPSDFAQMSTDGTIAMTVPGTWIDYEPIEPSGNDWVGFFAAPDIADYHNRWGIAHGMRLMYSYERGEEHTTKSWLESVSYGSIAVDEPFDVLTYYYEGHARIFEKSDGSRSIEFAVRQIGDDDGPLILFYVSHYDSLLMGRAYWMLDGLFLNPLPPPG